MTLLSARIFRLLPGIFLLACGARMWAGPPFQTDDPEPVDFRHYEFYQFGAVDSTPVETDAVGPALEFNWGAVPNVQLHVVLPFGASVPGNHLAYAAEDRGQGPAHYGLVDMELGVKYRFVNETSHRPQIGVFPMVEAPTGDSDRGLGIGKVWYKLPVWIQKSWGPWTSYGGGGYEIVPQDGYRNFAYAGWLVQRDIGKKLTLGAEFYTHQSEGMAAPQFQAAGMVDVGGYYYFKNPGLQLLFSYGHSVAGQTENYGYLGLYETWSSERGHGLNGFLARLL